VIVFQNVKILIWILYHTYYISIADPDLFGRIQIELLGLDPDPRIQNCHILYTLYTVQCTVIYFLGVEKYFESIGIQIGKIFSSQISFLGHFLAKNSCRIMLVQ
jgi:heme O synthase-like polyprenyltransferase